jgi:hypothetical protein
MKTQIYQKLTTYGIPGGEGSTALPTAFINVIASPGRFRVMLAMTMNMR